MAARRYVKRKAPPRRKTYKKPLDKELGGLFTDFCAAPVNVLTEGFKKKKMKRRR